MKVAVATQDLARVNAHLAWAGHLMFYDVSAEGYAYLDTASFGQGDLASRLAALRGCQLLFVSEVGPEGEHGLAQAQVVPIRQFAGQPVALALEALCDGLRGQPPLWLRQLEQRYRQAG